MIRNYLLTAFRNLFRYKRRTLLTGLLNLLSVHGGRVARREKNWPHSLVLLLSLFVVLGLGIVGVNTPSSQWIFQYIYSPLQATIFSLLAFLIVTAAYRALRLNSLEATVLLICSVFILIAQVPGIARIWSYLPLIRDWIFAVPVTAGMRGLIFGVALGTVSITPPSNGLVTSVFCGRSTHSPAMNIFMAEVPYQAVVMGGLRIPKHPPAPRSFWRH